MTRLYCIIKKEDGIGEVFCGRFALLPIQFRQTFLKIYRTRYKFFMRAK